MAWVVETWQHRHPKHLNRYFGIRTTHQLTWCYHSLTEQGDKLHLFPSPSLIFQLYSSIAHLGVGNKLLRRPRVTETWLNVLIYLQADIKRGVKGVNGSICRCVLPWWWLAGSPSTVSSCSAFILVYEWIKYSSVSCTGHWNIPVFIRFILYDIKTCTCAQNIS